MSTLVNKLGKVCLTFRIKKKGRLGTSDRTGLSFGISTTRMQKSVSSIRSDLKLTFFFIQFSQVYSIITKGGIKEITLIHTNWGTNKRFVVQRQNRSIRRQTTWTMAWNNKLFCRRHVCADGLERCIFEHLDTGPPTWIAPDKTRRLLSGQCFESDWLARVLKVDGELLRSKSSLRWPFVGYRLTRK